MQRNALTFSETQLKKFLREYRPMQRNEPIVKRYL